PGLGLRSAARIDAADRSAAGRRADAPWRDAAPATAGTVPEGQGAAQGQGRGEGEAEARVQGQGEGADEDRPALRQAGRKAEARAQAAALPQRREARAGLRMAASTNSDTAALAEFARANGLTYGDPASLPAKGATLTRDTGQVVGAATGALPGGVEGTLAYF